MTDQELRACCKAAQREHDLCMADEKRWADREVMEAYADATTPPKVLALLDRLAVAERDTARLDWLDSQCSEGNGRHLVCLPGSLRAAIDAALKESKQ